MSNLKMNISTYRQATALVDDITLFMCQFDKEAA
jgi:hypothetical protein